jgi:hypothetical protein
MALSINNQLKVFRGKIRKHFEAIKKLDARNVY